MKGVNKKLWLLLFGHKIHFNLLKLKINNKKTIQLPVKTFYHIKFKLIIQQRVLNLDLYDRAYQMLYYFNTIKLHTSSVILVPSTVVCRNSYHPRFPAQKRLPRHHYKLHAELQLHLK